MRKIMSQITVFLFCGALFTGGCAKEQAVIKDEPVTAPSAQMTPAKPADQSKSTVKEEKIVTPSIKESPVAKDEALTSSAKDKLERLLNAVYFDFDSSVLSQAARDTLSGNASTLLKKYPAVKVQVEGHCDERGSTEYNLALGERRAKSAMNYLVTLGVPADRLSIISYGKEKPADPGHDDAAWAKNRRAEFVIAR